MVSWLLVKPVLRMLGYYSLKRIVAAVSAVMEIEEEDIKRPGRPDEVQRSRELISYIARRHSDVGLGELARWLQVDAESCGEAG